jgi:hypothetical protein
LNLQEQPHLITRHKAVAAIAFNLRRKWPVPHGTGSAAPAFTTRRNTMHNTHTGNTHRAKRWLTGLLMYGCLLASQAGAAPSGKDMTIWFDLGGPVGESYVTVVQNGARQAAEDLGWICDWSTPTGNPRR